MNKCALVSKEVSNSILAKLQFFRQHWALVHVVHLTEIPAKLSFLLPLLLPLCACHLLDFQHLNFCLLSKVLVGFTDDVLPRL